MANTNRFGGIPLEEETQVSNRFGGISVDEPALAPATEIDVPDRSFLELGGDSLVGLGLGINSLLKLGGDLYGLTTGDMENWASQQGGRGTEFFNARKSDTLKALEHNRKVKIDSTDNEFAKAGHAFWETVSSPSLFASFAFEQAPMLLATMGGGVAVGAGAKILGATATTVGRAATAGAITTGGAMHGSDVGSAAYENLLNLPQEVWDLNEKYQDKLAQNIDALTAKQEISLDLSRDSALAAGILSMGLNMIPGAAKLEKALVGAKRTGAGGLQGFAKGFAGEGISEGLEEGSGVFISNIAAREIDPSIEITEGAGEAAGLGAAAAGFGGVAGIQGATPKSNREIIDDLAKTSSTIEAAPTVDAAIDAASAIVGAEVAQNIKDKETNKLVAEIGEAGATAEAAVEAGTAEITEATEAAKATAAPVVDLGPIDVPELTPAAELAPEPKKGGTFGGLDLGPTEAEIKPTEPTEPAKPLTEEERVAAEMDIQAKARLKGEEERIKREASAPQEAVISELVLSKDVPQFKAGATEEGVVEPLGGTFDRAGVGPIQVWVRKDGTQEVITGRHRLDLAKRSGMTTIPAQFHRESEGFDLKQAKALDATLNIREGQGQVKDYINFIKDTNMTEAQARAEGFLARPTGQQAFVIAKKGSELLVDAHSQGLISDNAAVKISEAAPNNEALQVVGLKAIEDGKAVNVAVNMVKAVSTMAPTEPQEGDLFGFDTGAIQQAEDMAKAASRKQAEIQRSLSAVQGASKRPELAAKEGVNIKDPAALEARIKELKAEKAAWAEWHTNPKLVSELKGEIQGEPVLEPVPVQEPVQELKERVVVEEPISQETFDTFKNAKDAVDWLASNAVDPVYKAIAIQIKDLIGTDIGFVMKGSGKRARSTRRGVYNTWVSPITGELVQRQVGIFNEGMQEGTLTHELTHAATSWAINNPKDAAQEKSVLDLRQVHSDVNSLMRTDPEQFSKLSKDEQKAFRSVGNDIHEFLTYSLTNPHFQSALKKLTFRGERISIFNKLSNVIKKLLGVKNVSDTLFARALEASSAVVESSTKVTASQPAPDTRSRSEKSKASNSKLRRDAYTSTLKGADERFTNAGYDTFMKDMKNRYKEANAKLPKDTIQGRGDFTQFIQAQVGQKVSLSDIKLTRKITGKDGKIRVAQGAADVILRQTKKKRDVVLKLLRCIQ